LWWRTERHQERVVTTRHNNSILVTQQSVAYSLRFVVQCGLDSNWQTSGPDAIDFMREMTQRFLSICAPPMRDVNRKNTCGWLTPTVSPVDTGGIGGRCSFVPSLALRMRPLLPGCRSASRRAPNDMCSLTKSALCLPPVVQHAPCPTSRNTHSPVSELWDVPSTLLRGGQVREAEQQSYCSEPTALLAGEPD